MTKHRKVTWIDQGWQPVAIGFVPDEDAFAAVSWRYKIADQWPAQNGQAGWCKRFENHETGESLILISIFGEGKSSSDVISTIVHESVHAWQFLCKFIGENQPGIEMEAYGIQHIFEGIKNAYEKEWGKL